MNYDFIIYMSITFAQNSLQTPSKLRIIEKNNYGIQKIQPRQFDLLQNGGFLSSCYSLFQFFLRKVKHDVRPITSHQKAAALLFSTKLLHKQKCAFLFPTDRGNQDTQPFICKNYDSLLLL